MPVGLLIANRDSEDGRGLVGELPVAGATLVEASARRLRAADVEPVLIWSERPGPRLAAAVERLRRDGIDARMIDGLAAMPEPTGKPVILVADGALVDAGTLRALAEAPAPAVLAIPDAPAHAAWERIDADRRWGGAMRVDHGLLDTTARDLADWDLASTMLRRTLQSGAGLMTAVPGGMVATIEDTAGARQLERALGERAADRPRGLADSWLLLPFARLLAPLAMRRALEPAPIGWAAAGLTLAAAPLTGAGHAAAGLAAVLAGSGVAAVARRMALVSWRAPSILRAERMRMGALLLALLALAAAGASSLTLPVLAATLLAVLHLEAEQRRLFAAPTARPSWGAEPDSLIWALLPFALAGSWTGGLLFACAYAFASLSATQRLTAASVRLTETSRPPC